MATIGALVVARKDVVLVLINTFKLGASTTLNTGENSVTQWLECTIEVADGGTSATENIWKSILRDLEDVALKVVTIKKSGSAEYTPGEGFDVNGCEGTWTGT